MVVAVVVVAQDRLRVEQVDWVMLLFLRLKEQQEHQLVEMVHRVKLVHLLAVVKVELLVVQMQEVVVLEDHLEMMVMWEEHLLIQLEHSMEVALADTQDQ
jgi:hypothetical protein